MCVCTPIRQSRIAQCRAFLRAPQLELLFGQILICQFVLRMWRLAARILLIGGDGGAAATAEGAPSRNHRVQRVPAPRALVSSSAKCVHTLGWRNLNVQTHAQPSTRRASGVIKFNVCFAACACVHTKVSRTTRVRAPAQQTHIHTQGGRVLTHT